MRHFFAIAIVFFCFIFLLSPNALADEWKQWEKHYYVAIDKEWTINFSDNIDFNTLSNDAIFVKDKNGEVFETIITPNGDHSVIIRPQQNYHPGETYFLYITNELKSESNMFLKEQIIMEFTTELYELFSIQTDGQYITDGKFSSFIQARDAVNEEKNQFIVKNDDNIVWTYDGVATSNIGPNSILILYNTPQLTGQLRYVSNSTELKYIDGDELVAKVQIANTIGYVSRDEISITPMDLVDNMSYYEVVNNELRHYVYRNNQYEMYIFGVAPDHLVSGRKYYSWDGMLYAGIVTPQYFNYLPLRTKTTYTAEQLDTAIALSRPDSPLIGYGAHFIQAESEHNINALYLLAHAIHESNWGTSRLAQEKNNLFGLNATDANPYEDALYFHSFEECILDGAKYISTSYLTPDQGFYNGAFLGNKTLGMNIFYASDPYWGQKIAGHMYRLDYLLGSEDRNKYQLAFNTEGLNVRIQPNTSIAAPYRYRLAGMSIALIGTVEVGDETWYEIIPDLISIDQGFIHGNYILMLSTP